MPTFDAIQTDSKGVVSADDWQTITLSDTVTYDPVPRAFMVDADGTLAVTSKAANTSALIVKAGVVYPIRPRIFKSTGSSGITNVFLLY